MVAKALHDLASHPLLTLSPTNLSQFHQLLAIPPLCIGLLTISEKQLLVENSFLNNYMAHSLLQVFPHISSSLGDLHYFRMITCASRVEIMSLCPQLWVLFIF